MTLLSRAAQRALELVLPARCVGCGAGGTYLCDSCIGGMVMPDPRTIRAEEFTFDTATAAFVYGGVARTAVHHLKFKNLRTIAPRMAVPMTAMLSSAFPADVVVPIPLHPSRLRERGYNQAALLAQPVAVQMGLAIEPTWLARERQSGRQVEADNVATRQANVRASFAAPMAVAGMRVALVDDVMTTGATLDAAARALKEAGAGEVHCITFARDL